MKLTPRSPQPRRTAAHLALALVAALALVGLTQCKLEPDKLTGVNKVKGAQGNSNTNCIPGCAHAANEAIRDESDLHTANVAACAGDPTCLANEEARHEAAVEAIQAERKACMDGCHNQGQGNGR